MKNKPYMEVIEGEQVVRQVNKSIPINIAVNMISKAIPHSRT